MKNIVIVMGLSGVGKTTLAEWIADVYDFTHLEFDLWEDDSPAVATLRAAWKTFHETHDSQPLKVASDGLVDEFSTAGLVLSFAGDDMVVAGTAIKHALANDIAVIVLTGEADDCRAAFVAREQTNGRGLTGSYWDEHNAHAYQPDYFAEVPKDCLIPAFTETGQRRTKQDLLSAVQSLIE